MGRKPTSSFVGVRSTSAPLACRVRRGRHLAQHLDRTVEARLDRRLADKPLDGPMVTRAEGLDPGVGMTVAAEALGLEPKRMQRIPERPVNQLQPYKLTGCEHASPQPRGIEQLHQRGVRVRITVRD